MANVLVVDVFVSIGSNLDREQNIIRALKQLRDHFGAIRRSSVYESEAVGFSGPPFLNLVVCLQTSQPVTDVIACLKSIEAASGRERSGPRFSDRTLDLDLLLYGDCTIHDGHIDVPRAEITAQAFILGPMSEIAGQRRHPEQQRTFGEIWAQFDQSTQRIHPYDVPGLECVEAGD